ncbi:MAG TPA: class I tRNA ligase family protein, partial [Candidatus Saccharimonadales bacterium]|nr:class I tRNA ligase family protein [Candidatus Saccharimonadales bacterium]
SKTFETSETFVPFVTSLEYTTFLKLLAPFAPHMTEELWEMLQKESKVAKESKESKVKKISDSIHDESWPEYEEALTKSKQVTIVVQVNGKVREKLLVEAGIAQKDAEKFAVASQKVQVFLGKKAPQKVIFIPDRLLNLVV